MEKINISLDPKRIEWLRCEAARLGITVSELIRRLVDKERGEL